jgi:hypothetical protein
MARDVIMFANIEGGPLQAKHHAAIVIHPVPGLSDLTAYQISLLTLDQAKETRSSRREIGRPSVLRSYCGISALNQSHQRCTS